MSPDVVDLVFNPEGLLLRLRRSKTDQEGEGREVAIPFDLHAETCPVSAVQAWLQAITEGPGFRPIKRHSKITPVRLSDHVMALVVKRYARAAGLSDALYSGHSLRTRWAT